MSPRVSALRSGGGVVVKDMVFSFHRCAVRAEVSGGLSPEVHIGVGGEASKESLPGEVGDGWANQGYVP